MASTPASAKPCCAPNSQQLTHIYIQCVFGFIYTTAKRSVVILLVIVRGLNVTDIITLCLAVGTTTSSHAEEAIVQGKKSQFTGNFIIGHETQLMRIVVRHIISCIWLESQQHCSEIPEHNINIYCTVGVRTIIVC